METTRASGPCPRRGGFALVLVLLVLAVTAALTVASVTLAANHLLVNRYHQRNDQLELVAAGGLEEARAMLNGNKGLYPDSGYVVLESGGSVPDGTGGTIPGVQRWLYAGPLGVTSGQYGIFGTIVSVARDEGGGLAVRRLTVNQESFAKFAYFTDVEPSNISFGGGDQIFGPVHTNDALKIYSSGATFHDETKTAKKVQGAQYGDFKKGYEEFAAVIPMPETADLNKLQSQAAAGGTAFTGTFTSSEGEATTRIEFMAIDLNGDGDATDDDEGFARVYQSSNANWVSGWSLGNCGYYTGGAWVGISGDPSWQNTLATTSTRRCHLGGHDSINGGFQANDGQGQWLTWGGPVSPLLSGRADASYLFPVTRALNPDFKGVIFVEGDVVLSGRLRGRVTVAATGDIIFGDDLVYATDPGLGTCEDILGVFSGDDVVVADNALNTALYLNASGSANDGYYTLDDTKDEFIHGVVLALDVFTVEDFADNPDLAEACEGTPWGRGCLYLTGGVIQRTRGAVGTINPGAGGTGYVKRYSYDSCARTDPPPYFPTTGHFIRGQEFPVDPVGFDVGTFYASMQSN